MYMYMYVECVISEIVCSTLCFHHFVCMHLLLDQFFDDFPKFQKLKQPLFLAVAAKTTRDKAPYFEERGVSAVSTERIKEWKRSELGENKNSSRETSYHG